MREKKRKTNMILNTLILIVFSLILAIGYQLLFSEKDVQQEVAPTHPEQKNQDEETNLDDEASGTANGSEVETSVQENETEALIVTEGEPDSEVEKVIQNPNWEPIGTEQTGEHVATYDQESIDWKEMERAIRYATGVPLEDMTILWLGNNGSPQDAVGTIQRKSDKTKYRVYITWVDGQGWKPTKVEVLK